MWKIPFLFGLVFLMFSEPDIPKDKLALIPEAVRDEFVTEFQNYEKLKLEYEAEKLKDENYLDAEARLKIAKNFQATSNEALVKARPFIKKNTGDGSDRTKVFRRLEQATIALATVETHFEIAKDPTCEMIVEKLLPRIQDADFKPLGTLKEYCNKRAKPLNAPSFEEFASELVKLATEEKQEAETAFSKFKTEVPNELKLSWIEMSKGKVIHGYFAGVEPSKQLKDAKLRMDQSGDELSRIWPGWFERLYTHKAPAVKKSHPS